MSEIKRRQTVYGIDFELSNSLIVALGNSVTEKDDSCWHRSIIFEGELV